MDPVREHLESAAYAAMEDEVTLDQFMIEAARAYARIVNGEKHHN